MPDPLYIAARCTLLDALAALHEHLSSVVLVGAQAVYMHADEADLAVAPFTTDGDLAIDPRTLASEPLLEVAMRAAEFHSEKGRVGVWNRTVNVGGVPTIIPVDLLIPDSLGGPGRRAARIPPHEGNSARRVTGLEAALVDNDRFTISALDAADERRFELSVAGPSALLVAKVHKIVDRIESPDRLRDKDALDVYRLLRVVQTAALVSRFQLLLENELSRSSTQRAIAEIPRLFGSASAIGSRMVVRAAGQPESGDTIAASITVLSEDLISALGTEERAQDSRPAQRQTRGLHLLAELGPPKAKRIND